MLFMNYENTQFVYKHRRHFIFMILLNTNKNLKGFSALPTKLTLSNDKFVPICAEHHGLDPRHFYR